jgi:hypothetical protein
LGWARAAEKERQGSPGLSENASLRREVSGRLRPIQIAQGQVQAFIKRGRFLGGGRDRHENIQQQQTRHDERLPAV